MKRRFSLILFSLFVLISTQVFSQKNFTKDADASFERGEYFNSIMEYKKAYSKERSNVAKARIIFQTAECYRLINDTKQAEIWYFKSVKVKYPDPIALLYLADCKKSNGKYDEALVSYQEYADKVPNDARGADGLASCELSKEWVENPTRYEVYNAVSLNSIESDFSPAYGKRGFKMLLFTSSREGTTGTDLDGTTGQNFTDIWHAKLDKKGSWNTPTILSEKINTNDNEGVAVMDAKYKDYYFTRCPIIKDTEVNCKIMHASKTGEAEEIQLVPDTITAGHPTITKDNLRLYFSSNLAGGYGGKDIWMVERESKKSDWGEPVNLGPDVNTIGDEVFPYIHEDGSLYFSSNGKPGMGGLDIFSSLYKENYWGNVSNLKFPINSEGDDFGIVFEGLNNRGFFTSNRKGGKGGDDIYQFVSPDLVFTLQGVVTDAETKEILVGATVTLVGDDGTSEEQQTDEVGSYFFQLKANSNYDLSATMPKYLGENGKETTVGLEDSKDLVHDFELRSIKNPIELPNILYDLDKWDLRPESKVSLDGLVKTLNDNPTIVIKIMSHTDTRSDDKYNLQLSQKRAQSVVNYLIDEGIASDRLEAKGYGEKKLLISDAKIKKLKTEEEREAAHQKNRRTEFEVLRTDYVPK